MKQILQQVLKIIIFFLLFFAYTRIVFMLFYISQIKTDGVSFGEIMNVFPHALRIDIATICFIMAIPFLVFIANFFVNSTVFKKIHLLYTGLVILILCLILGGELGIYGEWQSKFSYKALVYAKNPSEIVNSIATKTFLLLLSIVLISFALWMFIYYKFLYKDIYIVKRNYLAIAIFFLTFPPLLFAGVRGGIQPIPLSIADAYYSRSQILNDISVNSLYNLIVSSWKSNQILEKENFTFFPEEEALSTVDSLHIVEKDTTLLLLNNQRPNIVIVLLESWSSDMIASLGGDEGITPQFSQLEKEGLLFTQFYANANRSQEGIAAIFSAFPPLLHSTITSFPEKYSALSYFPVTLKKHGYQTEFIFGGDLNYGNLLSYIHHNQFDKILTEKDFSGPIKKGKLGVHDEFVFDRTIQEIDQLKEPFFTTVFTLSSHSPYDQPMKKVINWNVTELDYINSVYYTDKCLGDFIQKAKHQPWFNNTLFIFVADHSHVSHKNNNLYSQNYHHIPMLWYGNVLKPEYKNYQYSKLGGHIDMAATILKQLNLPYSEFKWSKDIMNPYCKEFVFIGEGSNFGWQTPEGYFLYNVLTSGFSVNFFPDEIKEKASNDGKSYMQISASDFASY